jgi:hypothetical protein
LFKYSNQTMWFQNVERELLRLWPQAKVTALDYSDPSDYLGEPIRVTISYSIPQFAAAGSGFILMTPPAVAGIFKSFQGHLSFDTGLKERKYAFRDRCSRVVEISEAITLPAYKKIARIPESVSKKGENVSYEGGYRITGNTLYFKSKSTLGKRIYESREWPDFKSVVEAQNQFAERPLILEL